MEKDYGYMPFSDYYGGYGTPSPENNEDFYKDPIFNPMVHYEQAFCYYRYLTMQMDYKIKCKEYEKMCKDSSTGQQNANQPNMGPQNSSRNFDRQERR